MAAIAEVAQAASCAVAGHVAVALGIHLGRALTRVYRLLRRERIEEQRLPAPLLRVRHQGREPLLLAIGWTEWHHEWRMLVAAVVVGCRAIPVDAAACSRPHIPRSPNLRETTCLRLRVHALHTAEQTAVERWLEPRLELRQAFGVRLVSDVMVTTGSGGGRWLRAWHLQPGQARDLGVVHLRQDRAVQVRVVSVWRPGHASPGGWRPISRTRWSRSRPLMTGA
jgi:hypothetical protein